MCHCRDFFFWADSRFCGEDVFRSFHVYILKMFCFPIYIYIYIHVGVLFSCKYCWVPEKSEYIPALLPRGLCLFFHCLGCNGWSWKISCYSRRDNNFIFCRPKFLFGFSGTKKLVALAQTVFVVSNF